jgi:hypothetical protein
MLGAIGSVLGSQVGRGLIGMIGGGMVANKGMQGVNKVMDGLGNKKEIEGMFANSQGLIDRIKDISQYSGAALDASTQTGNQAVRTMASMGNHGGSAMNAIRNRMKNSAVGDMYGSWQDAMKNVVLPGQLQVDENVSTEMFKQQGQKRGLALKKAQGLIDTGTGMMPNMSNIFDQGGLLDQAGGILTGKFGKKTP